MELRADAVWLFALGFVPCIPLYVLKPCERAWSETLKVGLFVPVIADLVYSVARRELIVFVPLSIFGLAGSAFGAACGYQLARKGCRDESRHQTISR